MRIFATEYTDIDCSRGLSVDIDLFSVDLVVALDGDVECLFLAVLEIWIRFNFLNILKTLDV